MTGPLQKIVSPKHFLALTRRWLPWLTAVCGVAFVVGLLGGVWWAPPDYQQGDGFRILYVHVPCAILSLTVYVVMAVSALVYFVWHLKLADVVAAESAPLGAMFTFLALVTGALWGKPMWGTWWIWDARLTSELILLFLYFGYMALRASLADPHAAAVGSGILAWVGLVDIPIIHYSVYWWNTLHQGATLFKLARPSIAPTMLYPLVAMLVAFFLYYVVVLLTRTRHALLRQKRPVDGDAF